VEKIIDLIWSYIKHGLDFVLVKFVGPLFSVIGKTLYFILLKPLALLQLPVFIQVIFIGILTGFLSIKIKKALKVQEKEEVFFKKFEKMRAVQKDFDLIKDWKMRKVLYEATDKDLDEEYNTFIAQKFSHFGMVYLLPIFLTLFWLDSVFSSDYLESINGLPYTLVFPSEPFGLPGLSLPVTFFIGYISIQIIWARLQKKKKKNKNINA